MNLSYPYFNRYTLKKVEGILKSGKVNYWTGSECKLFEKEFSHYIGTKYGIAVSNGSVALELAIKALELKKGSEIIVSPRSFIISASCVVNLGFKPVFADVDENGNLNIEGIQKAFNRNIKAIIIVHLNGLSCDLDPILKFVKKNKLFLIEDCSQAHGAIYKNRKIGSFGDVSTWSFCQDKIISTGGEGGIILTSKKKLWQKIWSLKDHGKNYKKVFYKKHKIGFKWLHDSLGSNYRMTEIQATIGRVQLKELNNQVKKRNTIAKLYINKLTDYFKKYAIFRSINFKCQSCPLKQSLKKCTQCKHAYYRLNFYLNKKGLQKKIISELNKKKVACSVGSCPEIYREKIFKKLKFFPKTRFPIAKRLGNTSIVFTINPYKSLKKIAKEIDIIKKILNYFI